MCIRTMNFAIEVDRKLRLFNSYFKRTYKYKYHLQYHVEQRAYIKYIQRDRKLNPFNNKGFPEKLSLRLIVKEGRVYRILARILENFDS